MSRAWMPLYVGDFLADTMDFDDRRTGMYLRLIMHCWQHGRIPADPEKLRIICHSSTKSWNKHCNILSFFQRMEDQQGPYYVHSRVTKERLSFEEKSRKNRANVQKRYYQSQSLKKTSLTSVSEPRPINQPLKISEELLTREMRKQSGH